MKIKERLAKLIRILSVPPVMVAGLLLILYFFGSQPFAKPLELGISLVLLGLVPLLAYPMQPLLPAYRSGGREAQRKLAFLFTGVGYTLALIYVLVVPVSTAIRAICVSYFLSALFLTLCNKVLHRRASGHACSAAGPLLYFVRYLGWGALLPCVIGAALIAWASLTLRRHTPGELLWGTLCSVAGFALAVTFI